VSKRPPLWTPEEARADADREGQPEETPASKWMGAVGDAPVTDDGCASGCVAMVTPCLLLVAGGLSLLGMR